MLEAAVFTRNAVHGIGLMSLGGLIKRLRTGLVLSLARNLGSRPRRLDVFAVRES